VGAVVEGEGAAEEEAPDGEGAVVEVEGAAVDDPEEGAEEVVVPDCDGAVVVDPVDVWHSFPENPALHTQTHPAHLPFPLHTTAVCLFPAEAKLGPEITFAAHEGEVG
jgi:hypothetical protein